MKRKHVWQLLMAFALIGLPGMTLAGSPVEGEKEIALQASYTNVDLGSTGGLDLGETTDAELDLLYGWFFAGGHELGITAAYIKQKLDGGDIQPDSETDGTAVGFFYHFNFKSSGTVTPFLGFAVSKLGGDIGEVYDLEYGAEAGLKLYPFEHGGVGLSLGYSKLRADIEQQPDATGVGLAAALLLKY